jgi:hypothetical protein
MVILYGGKIRAEGTCEELLASHEKTTIETDELDDQTIAEIDEIIRRRSGGLKSIHRVAAPPPEARGPVHRHRGAEQVDLSVIDSLLGDQKPGGDKGPERTP